MPPESAVRHLSTPNEIRKSVLERHAEELASWAVQREAGAAHLDPRGARQARLLAEELRALVASDLAGIPANEVSDAVARARSLMADLDAAPPTRARRAVIASTTHARFGAGVERAQETAARPVPARPPARPRLRTTLTSLGVPPRANEPTELELAYRDTVPAMAAQRGPSSDDPNG